MVREVRTLQLKSGVQETQFTGVAANIDPTSIRVRSLTSPDKVSVLEQNFEYDLVSSDKLLEKYLDQYIQVYDKDGHIFDGRLLSAAGGIVLEKKDGVVQSIARDKVRHFEFPKLPGGLITRPTLVWMISSEKEGAQDAEVSYLTGGMNWHAEYIALLDESEKKMELSAWVSIDNRSGADYESAKIKLIAGEVHRAASRPAPKMMRESMMAMEDRAPQFEEKSFFEYHLYTLSRPSTLRDRQVKQMALFPSETVPVQKIYKYDSAANPQKVSAVIEFVNSKENGLGLALPAGKVRLCKQDTDGSQELVGEDQMEHTAKDEKVRITSGYVFDIAVEKKQKEYRQLPGKARQETYEIKLRNHKNESVEIVVAEHLWGDWEIVKSTFNYEKKDANTLEFKVPVAKDGEAVLEYTVITRW